MMNELPIDGDGNVLHEGDRVFVYDFGPERIYGTLKISEEPETHGMWCVDYDDGTCCLVLSFENIWRADKG